MLNGQVAIKEINPYEKRSKHLNEVGEVKERNKHK